MTRRAREHKSLVFLEKRIRKIKKIQVRYKKKAYMVWINNLRGRYERMELKGEPCLKLYPYPLLPIYNKIDIFEDKPMTVSEDSLKYI